MHGVRRPCTHPREASQPARAPGARPAAYNLDGSHGDEASVLAIRPGGWAVFYAERGNEVGRRDFDTEDDACHYLLGLLIRDPTTRQGP